MSEQEKVTHKIVYFHVWFEFGTHNQDLEVPVNLFAPHIHKKDASKVHDQIYFIVYITDHMDHAKNRV